MKYYILSCGSVCWWRVARALYINALKRLQPVPPPADDAREVFRRSDYSRHLVLLWWRVSMCTCLWRFGKRLNSVPLVSVFRYHTPYLMGDASSSLLLLYFYLPSLTLFAHASPPPRSAVRRKVLASEERNCDWALTWWALADIPEPATPEGEFRMSYSTKQAIYYGEVRPAVGPCTNRSGVECSAASCCGNSVGIRYDTSGCSSHVPIKNRKYEVDEYLSEKCKSP